MRKPPEQPERGRRAPRAGDVIQRVAGREALVTARVEADGGRLAALLERYSRVVVAEPVGPSSGETTPRA
jgi:hypothetical protein